MPGRGTQRRYSALATWLFVEMPIGSSLSAEAITISGALAEIAEAVEGSDADPKADALDVSVTWNEDLGVGGEELER